MITLEQSGLTSDQYNALLTAKSGATWSVTAHRYNLNFTEVDTDQGYDNDTPDFDAAYCLGYLFRTIGGDYLERWTASGSWEQVSGYTGVATPIDTDSAQMTVDGNDLYIYVANASGIWQQKTSDAGVTWSAWTQVSSDTNINKIAAVNKDRIHYTVMDVDKNIYNLRVARNSSGWSTLSSDVWYTYVFSNFVAQELDDGSDVIVAATQVPGITTVKLVVNTPTKYIKPQGGLIGFKFKNGWWGDHYDIDVIDEITAYRFRDRIKMTKFSDRVAITSYGSDGTQLFPYTMYRIYTTKDGKYWSKGNALPVPDNVGSSGMKLVQAGDKVYALEKSRMYRSDMTLYLGYSPSSVQVVIPKSRIANLSLSEGDAMQGTMVLDNHDGYLDSIINKDVRTLLVFKMGYWVDNEEIKVQTHIAEIDTYDVSATLPKVLLRVSFRDFMAWMSDINNAERPYYWDSQLLGGDDFVTSTDATYDGLRHLEPQAGSFTSTGAILNLTSNNEEGVGFSTFSLYLWNGTTQSRFQLATAGNSEYAGLTFRASDKDNLWAAIYDQTTDKINLVERSGGTDTIMTSSSTMSWSSGDPTTEHWLQVEFRYARIIVRSSDDGITWTEQINYLMPIVIPDQTPDLSPLANSNKERGYVGFIGRGYAPPEVDTWPDDPLPWEPPDIPDYEPPYYPPFDSGYTGPYVPVITIPGGGGTSGTPGVGLNTTGNPKKIVTVTHGGDVWRATNLNANTGSITWQKAFSIPHRVTAYCKDPKKPARRWFGTEEGLYVCENIWAASATATLKATSAAIFNQSGCHIYAIHMSEKKPNWMLVQNVYSACSVSNTLGSLWNCINLTNGSAATGLPYNYWDSGTYGYWRDGMVVPYASNGRIEAVHGIYDGAWHYKPYVSPDWGVTWYGYPYIGIGSAGFTQARLYSPYRRMDNSINTVNLTHEVYITGEDSADGPGIVLSRNGGQSVYDDYSLDPPPGIGQFSYTYGGAGYRFNNQTLVLYGDQGFWSNPQTYKRKFFVLKQYGTGNKRIVVYSEDNFATAQVMNGFDTGFGATYPNNAEPMHIVGYPSNWNFLVSAQQARYGPGGFDGYIRVTPNLGTNWFNITPAWNNDPVGTPSEEWWCNHSPIAIDVE